MNKKHYLSLFGSYYAFRLRTHSIFEKSDENYFDVFVIDDSKLADYGLFTKLWQETLLMYKIKDRRIAPVIEFG